MLGLILLFSKNFYLWNKKAVPEEENNHRTKADLFGDHIHALKLKF